MALEQLDRVADTTTTTGTGTLTLAGSAPAGYRTFTAAHADGVTVRYCITSADLSQWEVGEGVFTTSGNTLSRARVFASSNSNSLVSFSAGTKNVAEVMTARAAAPQLSPDTPPVPSDPADDDFEYGTGLDTGGARRPSATAWAWVNQGSATAAVAQGALVLTAPSSASDNLRMVLQAISGSAWRFRAKMSGLDGSSTNYYSVGMVVRNSANSKLITFDKVYTTGFKLEVARWNSATSYSSSPQLTDVFSGGGYLRSLRAPMWMEIERTSTTLVFRFSDTGIDGTFTTFWTETLSTHILDVDGIGFYANNSNNTACWIASDWLRRMA